MKNFIFTGLFLSLFTFISCKENKSTIENENNEPELSNNVKITVNAIVKKDDIFQFFYNEDGSDTFPTDQVVTLDVKANKDPQDLVFNIPKDVLPQALRFDIGGNVEQEEIKLNKFQVDYLNKKITVKDTIFRYYFYGNEQIEYDIKTAIAKPKKIDGKHYDPIFMSTEDFKKELKNFYK